MSGGGGNNVEESPHTKELARIAKEKWGWYQQNFVPEENKYMGWVKSQNDPGKFDVSAAMGMNEARLQTAPLMDSTRTTMMSSGIDPSSGAFMSGMSDARRGAARSIGSAGMNAGIGMKDQYARGVENIVGMGQGQSGDATKSMADISKMSVQKAKDDAFSAWNDQQAGREIVGTAAGMGYKKWMDGK
jgi:hypothetical protein